MKCFERTVNDHITSTLPATLDPLQFAYRPNRSTDIAIAITMHTDLSHLDKRNTHVRMLFIDYSSAFNIIVPSKLIIKLEAVGLNSALCNWVLDFLTGHLLVVKVGNNISTLLILNTGAPQGYVLNPLLYSLFPHDCVALHASNSIIKFADDTTVVGSITSNNETAYREKLRALGDSLLISYVYTAFYTIYCILPMPLGHRSSIYFYVYIFIPSIYFGCVCIG
jgi:hypothetical protein